MGASPAEVLEIRERTTGDGLCEPMVRAAGRRRRLSWTTGGKWDWRAASGLSMRNSSTSAKRPEAAALLGAGETVSLGSERYLP